MSPTFLLISRRILQNSDIDAFNGIPETSPAAAVAAAHNTSAAIRRPALDPSAPFDSSMALTIIVLLTALFFLGFFSVYLRRFAPDASPAPTPLPTSRKCVGTGLDSSAVDSLPLVPYGGAAKHPMIENCPICLSEFSEKETVKLIPHCGHVFHPKCIDTWLAAHVTCPLCRSAELFDGVEELRLDVAPPHRNDEIGSRSTVEIEAGIRRACSCSNLANRAVLQRSNSF